MFAPSKRQIDVELAREITSSLPSVRPAVVGVFVNASPGELLATRDAATLDVLQLSGDESPTVMADLEGARVWKALRFPAGTNVELARRMIEPWLNAASPVETVLVDAAISGAYGGTGHRADWTLIAGLTEQYPLVLAGGLAPVSVAEAIEQVRPAGVDVSSGVETDGQKDPALIQSFVRQANDAFRRHMASA
jgi:phosphoribosylanthranilate isomerase